MRVTPPPPSPLEGGAGHSDLERAQDDSAGCDAETSAAQEHHGWLKWGWLMCMEGGGGMDCRDGGRGRRGGRLQCACRTPPNKIFL